MDEPKVIGLIRAWNEHLYIREIMEKALVKCDHLVVMDNQSDRETAREISLFASDNKSTVSLIAYRSIGQVHESGERNALYHFGRCIADSIPGKSKWFYTLDADEILDCRPHELRATLAEADKIGARGVKVKLVNLYINREVGETDHTSPRSSLEDSRSFSENRYRPRPYFYKHIPNKFWWLSSERFHSCLMYIDGPEELNNEKLWMQSELWVKHYGYAISSKGNKDKSDRYKEWGKQGDRTDLGDWRTENLKRNIFDDVPTLYYYIDVKNGTVKANASGL